jgi:PAS domain S-box-containing protein
MANFRKREVSSESATAAQAAEVCRLRLGGDLLRILTRPLTAWLLLAVGLLATLLLSLGAWHQVRSRDETQFIARTEAVRQGLLQEFDRYAQMLQSSRALWAIHPQVTRDEWRLYVDSLALSNTFPALRALGYIERVSTDALPGFVEKNRQGNSRDDDPTPFEVHPRTSNQDCYVVKFVEPLEFNRPALGYDIGSEPTRREAAEWARDTDQVTLSRKITLVQTAAAPGVLLLLPVYSPGTHTTNTALRRANLQGWVYAAFVVEDLVSRVLAPGVEDLELAVFDGTGLESGSQFFASEPWEGRPKRPPNPGFERTTTLVCGNGIWTLHFNAGASFMRKPLLSAPGYVDAALLGLCMSLLVFGIARALASTQRRARTLAEEMTAKLRLQNHAMASAKNGLFILDATREDCPIIYANPAFQRMTHYSLNGTLGPETITLLKKDAVRADLPGMRSLLKTGGEGHSVVREYRRDGTQFWADFQLVPVLDEQGRKTHYLGIAEDVTERKRAEDQLVQAKQRYQELVENLNVGVYRNTAGSRGKLLEANPATVAMFEASSREELMRHAISDLYANPAERKKLSELIRRQGFVKDAEIELHTLKGRRFWAAITATMKTGANGEVFFDGVIADITERKQAEQALKESQERFALAVQGTNDGIWDWNVTTNEVYFSPRWKGMLGYSEDEVENTFAGWERLVHPDDRERARAAIQAYFAGQSSAYELEHRLQHKDGTYRWILARGVAMRDAQGTPLRMAGSHVDLTGRKRAEERLRLSYVELARSQEKLQDTLSQLHASHEELKRTQLQLIQAAKMESIGTLAAGVAHEVKNPLQTILMGLDYIGQRLPEPAETLRSVLGDMRDAVWRADNIVKELLQLSANTAFELAEGDLNAVVARSLRLINSELIAAHVGVVSRLDPGLPLVRMDVRKLEQVFLNLFINAIQAMTNNGSLLVTTRTGRLAEDLHLNGNIAGRFQPGDRLVVVDVQDSGPGIPPEHLARIFDPFFTTKPVGKGTGLGLSIVKKITDLHEGAMEVKNAPEGGVLVTLAFRALGENL